MNVLSTACGKRTLRLVAAILLGGILLGAAGCGTRATTLPTTPALPAPTTGSTSRTNTPTPIPTTDSGTTDIQPATEPEATPTVPPADTPTPSTPHIPPTQATAGGIAPSPSFERWPAQSSVPVLYQARRAGAGSATPLAGMTVLLDAGHGGKDPGAIAADGTYEKSINLPITLQTRTFLEQMGATVILTRADDTYVSVYGRIANTGSHILQRAADLPGFADHFDLSAYMRDLNQIKADNTGDWDGAKEGRGWHLGFGVREEIRRLMDLERQFTDTIYVSIHCNSAGQDTTARGLQIYYSSTEYVYADEVYEIAQDRDVFHWGYPVYQAYTWYDDSARAALASAVFQAVAGAVPQLGTGRNAGVRLGNYGMLREQNLASVLVECGFMSSPEDLALLKNADTQQAIARSVAEGIRAYFLSR